MNKNNFDFSGYATRVDLQCSDGRIIKRDAFKHNDGQIVPLVWQHVHNDVNNVLGHALLENREDGVYTYCKFNETEAGKNAKLLVSHGDIKSLSIYANQLRQKVNEVIHGDIKEVSLVLAGANPGAFIDNLCIQHGDGYETIDSEAIIYTGGDVSLSGIEHSDKSPEEDDKTIKDIFEGMSEEQKNVCYVLIGQALEEAGVELDDDSENEESEKDTNNKKIEHSNGGGNINMKKNIFDKGTDNQDTLSHADMTAIFTDAKRYGSLKDSALAHGITNIDYLFPEATNLDGTPQFVKRDTGWVAKVMAGVHKTPFSRIRSTLADITKDEARAKGYIKGKEKTEEVFSLLKRTTTPTTVYKKQKLDRDDVVDITDFDVVAWLKAEMRIMLDEEIARAVLIGDGRLPSSDDKINESNIRPIWKDEDLYAVKATFDAPAAMTADQRAKEFIRSTIKARKNYKGSGDPTLFITEDMLTDCLLLEDTTGRIIYDSVAKLATVLRVKEIITVAVMEGQTRTVDANTLTLHGIVVNLEDYNVGADKGGAVNLFDDFDIDYNAQKYLIETRASGALVKPYSALVIESKATA